MVIGAVSAGVSTLPLVAVFPALAAVKAADCGLEITHDCIPALTHPTVDFSPGASACGRATSTIEGRAICTVHVAVLACPCALAHPRPNAIDVLAALPIGATTDAVPESAPPVEKFVPVLVAELPHAYVIAMLVPASAIDGAQEISAVGAPGVVPGVVVAPGTVGAHTQPFTHCWPLDLVAVVSSHVPEHAEAGGICGGGGHAFCGPVAH